MVSPREVLALCREKSVRGVDLWFTDWPGRWQRITLPAQQLDEELFEQGVAGQRAYLGLPTVCDDELVLFVPQPDTAFIDPTAAQPTLGLICGVVAPYTGEESCWDPRLAALRAVSHLSVVGGARAVDVGWSLDYYLFRSRRGPWSQRPAPWARDDAVPHGLDALASESRMNDSSEAQPIPAGRGARTVRHHLAQALATCQLPLAAQHSLLCGPGQQHIELMRQPLVRAADGLMMVKHFARQLARAQGLRATFMPQPLHAARGSELAVQLALRDHDRPVFAGSGYAGLSDTALYAIGGLLRHAPSLAAWTNPSTNSYKRLASEPLAVGYSQRPQAMVMVPNYQANPAAKRIVYRVPDATANPYLALAALVMAMVDGIQNKMHPGKPWEQASEGSGNGGGNGGSARVMPLPVDLDGALEALAADHDFLLRGDVFTEETVRAWIRYKTSLDIASLRTRPHPHEYEMYFDC